MTEKLPLGVLSSRNNPALIVFIFWMRSNPTRFCGATPQEHLEKVFNPTHDQQVTIQYNTLPTEPDSNQLSEKENYRQGRGFMIYYLGIFL